MKRNFESFPEGEVYDLIAVSRLDQKNTPQRSLRLCGEPSFERHEYQSKSPRPKGLLVLGLGRSILLLKRPGFLEYILN
jgi:hypothetical protein